MVQSRDLAARFEAYGDWRRRLSAGDLRAARMAVRTRTWPTPRSTSRAAAARAPAPGQAGRRLRRRVLARQVRAHQRDLLRRLRPAAAAVGRRAHDDVPDRDPARCRRARRRSACCRSRRASRTATVAELKNYADEWVTLPLDLALRRADGRRARARVAGEARADRARAPLRPVTTRTWSPRSTHRDEGSVDIPCWRHAVINFPHPLLQAGAGDPRHARPQRDRHRARAHAVAAAVRARGAVHPRRRHRRHQDRPRRLEGPPRRRRPDDARRAARDPEQDRRPVGRDEAGRRRSRPRSTRQVARQRARCSPCRSSRCSPVSAQKALLAKVNGDDALLAKSRLPRLETALSGNLVPAKREIVGAATRSPRCARWSGAVRAILDARTAGIAEQLGRAARAARQEPGRRRAHDAPRAATRRQLFERGLSRFSALRNVFTQQTTEALRPDRPRGAARQRGPHAPHDRGEPVHQGRARRDERLLRADPQPTSTPRRGSRPRSTR